MNLTGAFFVIALARTECRDAAVFILRKDIFDLLHLFSS